MSTQRTLGRLATYLLLVGGTVAFLFPLWWMVAVSLKTPDAAQAATVQGGFAALAPSDPRFDAVEHSVFDAAALVAACPARLSDLIASTSRLRTAAKET